MLEGAAPLAALAAPLEALCAAANVPLTSRLTWLWASLATSEWLRPWAVVVGVDGQLEGAAILATRRTSSGLLLTTPRCDSDDVVAFPCLTQEGASVVAATIAGALHSSGRRWRLDVPQLRTGDAVGTRLLELLDNAQVTSGRAVPRVALGSDRRLDAYLSKSMRTSLRRARTRLHAGGLTAQIDVVRDPGAITSLLPVIEAIHVARDHDRRRGSDLDDPTTCAFWREAIIGQATAGTLSLFVLRIGGAIAAYAVVLVDADAYRLFDGRLSTQWARYAPGRLVEAAVLEHALSRPEIVELDWMSSVAPQSLLAANDQRRTVRVTAEDADR